MDFYFTDRQYNVIEIASTGSSTEYKLTDDLEKSSIEANTRALTGTVRFDHKNILRAQEMCAVGNYILYKDEQQNDIFMTIMESHSNSTANTIQFTAEDAGVDLLNETVGDYKATKALKFADYFNTFTSDSGWMIGINEISTLTRTLEWSGEESSYDRMQSVATQFGAELYFSFEIDGTSVVKRQMNVVKHRGESNNETLYVGKELNSITVDSDIYSLVTSIKATGGTPENSETPITLKGYKYTDSDGRFVLGADGIMRDTVAVQTWSRLRNNDNPNPDKSHLQQVKSYEAVTQATLCQSVLADLKKNNHPAVNYVLDIAYLPQVIAIGDTIHAADDDASLYVSARLLELSKSRSTNINTAVLGDYLIEHDTVSSALRDLADDVKNMPKSVQYYPWVRYADDADGNGFSMLPEGKAYMAVVYGKTSTPSNNPSDYAGKWQKVVGPNGQDGADGIVGPAGKDGQTSYFHRAYANSLDGKTDFSVTDGNGKSYMGTYSDFIKADSTDPTKYNWALFKGPQGVKGDPGANGSKGPAGADGKSSYLHTAYAQSADGKTGFSTTDATDAIYIGVYSDQTETDSTDPAKYSWVKAQGPAGADGAQGTPGKAGADGRTPYVHYAWATNSTGTTGFSTTDANGKTYVGVCTDYNQADPTTPSSYTWSLFVGPKGDKGEAGVQGLQGPKGDQGIAGPKGSDGKTQYTHIAYANSEDGKTDFTVSDSNREYIGMYVDFTATDSTAPADYSWTLVKGANGANGTPGKAGADGKTPYFHQAWADSQDGQTNFSTTVSLGKKYLGTYTDFTSADSTDPTKYKWVELAGAVEQRVDDAINSLVPSPSSGISYPTNPKKGQQHWLTDANGKPKGLFQYDGTEWVAVPVNADTISANTLNGMTINGVTINGSTINSPNINVPFNNVPANPDEPEGSPFATFVSGTTKLTSNLNISGNITDGTNKTPQWVKTLVSPQGFSSIISTPDASKALSVVQVSLGAMFLSEWHSDVTANDGFVSSYLKAGDTTTYEYVDTLAANDNINSGTVRYTRKGSQVNVGFRFNLKNDTGWVALGKIRTGYTPNNMASVGVSCPCLSYRGYSCVVYPNNNGWRLIPTLGQGVGDFQGSVSYTTYDYYPYNDAK